MQKLLLLQIIIKIRKAIQLEKNKSSQYIFSMKHQFKQMRKNLGNLKPWDNNPCKSNLILTELRKNNCFSY